MTRAVTLVCGPPCAGKTTYVRMRAQPQDLVLDRDTLNTSRPEQAMRQAINTIASMHTGQAWIIRSLPDGNTRRRLATALNADIVLLRPPADTLRQRALQRPNPVATLAAIGAWNKRYTPTPGTADQPAPKPAATPRPRSPHRSGRPWRTAKARMHAEYGHTCHLCGHGGAGEADHLDPLAFDPGQPIDWRRMRPAHGSNYPCPICPGGNGKGRACNQERGVKPAEAVWTPRIAW